MFVVGRILKSSISETQDNLPCVVALDKKKNKQTSNQQLKTNAKVGFGFIIITDDTYWTLKRSEALD